MSNIIICVNIDIIGHKCDYFEFGESTMKKNKGHSLVKKATNSVISMLLALGLVQFHPVTTIQAKEIGEKNESQKAGCEAVISGSAPAGYTDVLDNGSVFRGGQAKSGVQSEEDYLDDDPNDFAKPLPYGNTFVDVKKIKWVNGANYIIDIKDDRFKWIALTSEGENLEDLNGNKPESDPMGIGKGINVDSDANYNSAIGYVGELNGYLDNFTDTAAINGIRML